MAACEAKGWGGGGANASSAVFGDGGILDVVITVIFCVEVAIKVLANGLAPWNYWVGHDWEWNNFDFAVVVLSFKQVAGPIFGGGGSTIRLLRLVRLARLWKLVEKVRKLHSIVQGLVKGISSVGWIGLMLFLVYYIFAIGAVIFFGDNDPLHFRSLPIALLSLFRASTMEDWTDIMYVNMFGCRDFSSGYYYVKEKYRAGGQDVPGAWDGDPFHSSWDEIPNYFKCTRPEKQPGLSVAFWVAFELVAIVMLSLFIGAVTGAMQGALAEAKARDELEAFRAKEAKAAALEKARSRAVLQAQQSQDLGLALPDADGDGIPDVVELSSAVVGKG